MEYTYYYFLSHWQNISLDLGKRIELHVDKAYNIQLGRNDINVTMVPINYSDDRKVMYCLKGESILFDSLILNAFARSGKNS